MYLRSLLLHLLTFLVPLAALSTLYLYLYPVFHSCAFPVPRATRATASQDALNLSQPFGSGRDRAWSLTVAPFRLLVLADPQLEGDSSLPDPDDALYPRLARHWSHVTRSRDSFAPDKVAVQKALKEIFLEDIPDTFQALRKRVDLFGNDYYLAHIFRALHWWTEPTHVTVLGDLIGSQWVTDEEFERRGWRYWNRVFAAGQRVEDGITISGTAREDEQNAAAVPPSFNLSETNWAHRIINVVGNHDIGYAGDASHERIARFEKSFGRANWDVRFQLSTPPPASTESDAPVPSPPTLHLIVLNSLVLDTPAISSACQDETYAFLNSLISSRSLPAEESSSFTLLLTHLPLRKPAGVCVDAPHFAFYRSDDNDGRYKAGGLKEQNHLSEHVSQQAILEGIFGVSNDFDSPTQGRGRNGLILTGHDHEGCDVWHHITPKPRSVVTSEREDGDEEESSSDEEAKATWEATRWQDVEAGVRADAPYSSSPPPQPIGIREVTLRSMMGEFGGNAGLLSVWFDLQLGQWQYEITMCRFGVQHIWWGVHVLDLVTATVATAWLALVILAIPSHSSNSSSGSSNPTPPVPIRRANKHADGGLYHGSIGLEDEDRKGMKTAETENEKKQNTK